MNYHPTKYWHKLKSGRIQCDLCPRGCKLHNGEKGFCFVRVCEDDQIVLTTYGRSSGFCIDPIEKKPLSHFLPGTPVLSFGTAGCNLGCKFCQNWDISKSHEIDTLAHNASPHAIAMAAQKLGCPSVAFTYNDPVIFIEYAIDIAIACHEIGIKTVAVTAGEIRPDPRIEFFKYMDATNVDLKGFTESFYKRLCDSSLRIVKETLEYLKHETDVWFEITNLVIPGENDSDEEIENMTKWIVESLGDDVPTHFTAFHPDYLMMQTPPTKADSLKHIRDIAKRNGLKYVYTGNVHDPIGNSTYCHKCHNKIIGRNWHELTEWNLDESGNCYFCGTVCAGVFDGPPGSWGSRSQIVRMQNFSS